MTKKKSSDPNERIYDRDGFWLRAACVCVKDDTESEVLLISSSAYPDRWIIPGGKIQENEKPEHSAMREAKEEAGVVGCLGRCLGVFDNLERKHRTKVFVLRVKELLEEYEDVNMRKRSWFPLDEASRILVTYKPLHSKYLLAMSQSSPSTTNLEEATPATTDKTTDLDFELTKKSV